MTKQEMNEKWNRVIAGDKSAFTEVFSFYYPKLMGYGVKIVKDEALVQDVIQDLFYQLWNERSKLEQILSVDSYLFRSIRNNLLYEMKLKNRSEEISDKVNNNLIEDNIESTITTNESSTQLSKNLKDVLGNLSDRQREMIELKYFHNLTYEEIEEVTGIKYQSIRNTVHRALNSIRNIKTAFFD